jgi:hypothetical protein
MASTFNYPRYTGGIYPDNSLALNYASVVHRKFLPDLIDQALRKKPMFLYMLLKDCMVQNTGGFAPITQPVLLNQFDVNTFNMRFDGSGDMSPVSNPIINAEWLISGYGIFMQTPAVEASLMQADPSSVVINTIRARLTDFMSSLIDLVDSKLLSAPATDLDMDGIVNAIDDGTTYGTYGGIQRSTNPKWKAPIFDYTTYSSNFTNKEYLLIPYLVNAVQNGLDDELPNIIFCSYGTFDKLANSLINTGSGAAVQQFMTIPADEVMMTRTFGIQSLVINGIPIFPLAKITDGTIYFMNGRRFQLHIHPDYFFSLTEPESMLPVGVHGWVNALEIAGNLICTEPISNFKVVNFSQTTLPSN